MVQKRSIDCSTKRRLPICAHLSKSVLKEERTQMGADEEGIVLSFGQALYLDLRVPEVNDEADLELCDSKIVQHLCGSDDFISEFLEVLHEGR